jgi:hypothetical protein
MIAGSEAYQAALLFYKAVKMAAEMDIQGAKAIYEELRKRFEGQSRRRGKDNGESDGTPLK